MKLSLLEPVFLPSFRSTQFSSSSATKGLQRQWLSTYQNRGPQFLCYRYVSTKAIEQNQYSDNAQPADELSHSITAEEKAHFDRQIVEDKGKQIRTPWHREGSEKPPVARNRSAGAMTKGKLLTTPSRMLKLVLPLTTRDANSDRKDVEPLALLVHPQQPLSYLERLVQSELPMIRDGDRDRVPSVYFRAQDSLQEAVKAKARPVNSEHKEFEEQEDDDHNHSEGEHAALSNPDEINIDGKTQKTGKLNRHSSDKAAAMRGGPGEGGVESYSGLGQSGPSDAQAENKFVRWSNSTEIGDFIRDAARGREFAVEIEGAPHDIRVGVPSFLDRTFYLRMRLRNISKKISGMADLKHECDRLAHRGAQRVALGGFGILCGWWYLVYRLTFETELGWDVMEPVTYLVGLSTLIGGYIWFLWHNREASYRAAMNITISRRQSKLYAERGFDPQRWTALIEEGNALRREIKAVADAYDVYWDEREDEDNDEKVIEALKKDRDEKKGRDKKSQPDREDGD